MIKIILMFLPFCLNATEINTVDKNEYKSNMKNSIDRNDCYVMNKPKKCVNGLHQKMALEKSIEYKVIEDINESSYCE